MTPDVWFATLVRITVCLITLAFNEAYGGLVGMNGFCYDFCAIFNSLVICIRLSFTFSLISSNLYTNFHTSSSISYTIIKVQGFKVM
jgi:hypothetical protein